MEDVEFVVHDPAHAIHLVAERGAGRVHVTVGIANRLRLVVGPQARVVAKAHGDRFVAPVHGDEVDVQVDDEVGFGRPPVHPHRLPVPGPAELHDPPRILGVVVVIPRRVKRLVDRRADHAPHLGLGHLPVERVRDDEVDIVHAVVAQELEHHLERRLAHVRRRHRRQRQADVVESDGHPHPGSELRVKRVAPERVVQRVADRASGIRESPDRRRRVDHPGAHREALLEEILPAVQHARGRVPLEEDDVRIGPVAEGRSHRGNFRLGLRWVFVGPAPVRQPRPPPARDPAPASRGAVRWCADARRDSLRPDDPRR